MQGSNNILIKVCLFFLIITIICCKSKNKTAADSIAGTSTTLFTTMPSEQTGINFINNVEDTKDFNILTYRNFYNGGGVAIGDINNDSLADIFFTSNLHDNKLFLNKGNWKFEDITEKSGVKGTKAWSTGVTMADVNGDGWLDIYVCNSGDVTGDDRENELFINQGLPDGSTSIPMFQDQAKAFHLNDEGFSTHASFFDFDADGDLDCYVLNNSFKNPDKISMNILTRNDKDHLGGDKLFRNDNNIFTEVTHEAGIYNSKIGFGLGISVSDINNDFLPDIFISNDFWERDYLYINQGNGKFSEELTTRISVCSVSSMGSDIADINNDGTYDIFTTDMLPADNYRLKTMTAFDPYHLEDLKFRNSYHYQILQNTLQLNDGSGNFQEIAHMANVGATDWSWGALIFDFDNDGWKDIFVSNGIYRDIMYLDFTNFINDQENVKKIVEEKGQFDWRDFAKFIPSNPLANYAFQNTNTTAGAIPVYKNNAKELGLHQSSFSNGAAYGDLDNDGDLDLAVNNVNMPAFIYQNHSTNNYLKVKFIGNQKNKFGIGTVVKIEFATGEEQVLQNYSARGFESSVEPILIFGLGNHTKINRLTVTWPDHTQEILYDISVNTTIILNQQNAHQKFAKTENSQKPLYSDVSSQYLIGDSHHKENSFNDFDSERLLLKMLSTEGPKIVKGDLNQDQREDFIVLGAAGDPDKIFIQQSNGTFVATMQDVFLQDKEQESTCGALFDYDQDGDNDLLIGSGGNEFSKGIENFILRFYENNGNGNFSKVVEKTPHAAGNFSCILPADFDKDGLIDLFIGGRSVPGNYGLPPRSYLFRNEGNGKWTDVIPPQSSAFGMVTDGIWCDHDKDGDDDLILVGEWMPILILENGGKGIVGANILPKSTGWWNCIKANDFDNDGDQDFVVGNWGLNSKLKASPQKPLVLYVNDFDKNNKSEFIINWYPPLDNTLFPFASKKDLTDQLPFLKKSILKYEDYAHKTFNTLFNENEKKGAVKHEVECLESVIVWNDKNKLFRMKALPLEAQISPVFGIIAQNLNDDPNIDIWLGGNFYGLKPEMGRHDSSKGIFLEGDGKGNFNFIRNTKIGIKVDGEVRDATMLNTKDKSFLVIARNNKEVKLYTKQ